MKNELIAEYVGKNNKATCAMVAAMTTLAHELNPGLSLAVCVLTTGDFFLASLGNSRQELQ